MGADTRGAGLLPLLPQNPLILSGGLAARHTSSLPTVTPQAQSQASGHPGAGSRPPGPLLVHLQNAAHQHHLHRQMTLLQLTSATGHPAPGPSKEGKWELGRPRCAAGTCDCGVPGLVCPLCSPAWCYLTGRFRKGADRSHLAGAPLRGLAVLQLLVGDTGLCPTPLPEKRRSLSGPSVLGSENRRTPQCFPIQRPWTPGDRREVECLVLLSHPGVSSARSTVLKWGLRGAQDSRGLCS